MFLFSDRTRTNQTSDPAIVELSVVASLLTVSVSRALLGVFQELFPGAVFPHELLMRAFWPLDQLILEELEQSFGYPLLNLSKLLFRDGHQPEKSRLVLSEHVVETFTRMSSD